MYILNLARAYTENSGENTWREMFLLRYHCWQEVNSTEKKNLKNTILGENVAITVNSYRPLKDFKIYIE